MWDSEQNPYATSGLYGLQQVLGKSWCCSGFCSLSFGLLYSWTSMKYEPSVIAMIHQPLWIKTTIAVSSTALVAAWSWSELKGNQHLLDKNSSSLLLLWRAIPEPINFIQLPSCVPQCVCVASQQNLKSTVDNSKTASNEVSSAQLSFCFLCTACPEGGFLKIQDLTFLDSKWLLVATAWQA